jgi:hypothetical protein
MKTKLHLRTMVWVVVAAVALIGLTAGADAVQGDKKIRMYDDCEPTTFNAVLGEGTCVGKGHTTFDEFIEELTATQDVHTWRNQPSAMQVNVGRPTIIENRGGEDHTFTQVDEFGGGVVPVLNQLSGNPVAAPECLGPIVLIHAGETEAGPTAGSSELPVGSHKFQCCIHPWMRTTIDVESPGSKSAPAPTAQRGHH